MMMQGAPTPQRVQRLRSMAQQLSQTGTSTAPVSGWGEGLGRVAQALIGGYMANQAEDQEREGRASANAEISRFLMGGEPGAAQGGQPLGPMARRLMGATAMPEGATAMAGPSQTAAPPDLPIMPPGRFDQPAGMPPIGDAGRPAIVQTAPLAPPGMDPRATELMQAEAMAMPAQAGPLDAGQMDVAQTGAPAPPPMHPMARPAQAPDLSLAPSGPMSQSLAAGMPSAMPTTPMAQRLALISRLQGNPWTQQVGDQAMAGALSKRLAGDDTKPMVIGEGGVLVDPRTGQVIARGTPRQQREGDAIQMMRAAGIDPASPEGQAMARRVLDAKLRVPGSGGGAGGASGEGGGGGGAPGAFRGTGFDAQSANMLLSLPPTDPRYAIAFNQLYGPRTQVGADGIATVINPEVPLGIARPTARATAEAATMPTASPSGSAPGQVTTQMPVGSTGSVTQTRPLVSSGQKKQFDDAVVLGAQMTNALEDFRSTAANAGLGERAKSVLGANTPSNTTYNSAALLAKGEELFNLGVLNGPDLAILRRVLPDPSTVTGAITSDADRAVAVNSVLRLVQDRITARAKQYGIEAPNLIEYGKGLRPPPPSAPPPAGGAQASGGDLPTVTNPADAARLPSGTRFKLPDGRIGTVP